ncbi:glycosyltransferase family 52 [Mannheimia granulomatis]|nr:glycosyltransferase family 52 [Mannheimia granulomatis]
MLMLFFLINDTSLDKVFFIFDNNIKIPINIVNYIRVRKSRNKLELIWNAFYYLIRFHFLCFKLGINGKKLEVYGADHITGAKFFLKRYNFILIEDGTINYSLNAYVRSIKNRLFSIPSYGVHKNVSKIYLTKSDNIPSCIKDKVEVIDIKELWNKKHDNEKVDILRMLNVNIDSILKLKGKSYILYTQPLSEDGVISEEEKIKLYENILQSYDLSRLVIKPHPREKTSYEDIFKGAYTFRDNIPAEILSLLDIEFEKAITVFSTAVLQHSKENIVFYGTKIHPKIYHHFGDVKL